MKLTRKGVLSLVAVLTLLLSLYGYSILNVKALGVWQQMASCPQPVFFGGSLAWAGGDYIYALSGVGTPYFFRYSISGNSWRQLAFIGPTVSYGGSLAWAGGDYIYALPGGNTPLIRRYSISGDSWQTMMNCPRYVGTGGSFEWAGGDYIYALLGAGTPYFFRYSISGNSWQQMTNCPYAVTPGGSLVWTGGDYIYAFPGGNTPLFYKYSISGDSWQQMTNCPYAVLYGGSLEWTVGDYIYAFPGGNTPLFYKYSISGDSWQQLTLGPTVSYGGSLAWAGGDYIYALPGYNTPLFFRYRDDDVAVISVVASANEVEWGEMVNITAVVKNEGLFTETFNVTAIYDSTEFARQTVSSLAPGNQTTLGFTWNTTDVMPGNYTISVEADVVPGEIDVGDNIFIYGNIHVKAPDVAVLCAGLPDSIVGQGFPLLVNVSVAYEGYFAANFNITAYANYTEIGKVENIYLEGGNSTSLLVVGNTSSLAEGFYMISVNATSVYYEIQLGNNFYNDGVVAIYWLWDVTGDDYTGIDDIIFMAEHFGQTP